MCKQIPTTSDFGHRSLQYWSDLNSPALRQNVFYPLCQNSAILLSKAFPKMASVWSKSYLFFCAKIRGYMKRIKTLSITHLIDNSPAASHSSTVPKPPFLPHFLPKIVPKLRVGSESIY